MGKRKHRYNSRMPQRDEFDVCIVGSGPGGGIAAYALTLAGLRVALVESGRALRAGVDYNAHGPAYQHLDERLRSGRTAGFRVTDFNERDHFVPEGDRPGYGFLRALGGRSLCWAGHTLRFGPKDFDGWPLTYKQIAPYYSRAERMMAVYGDRDGLWNMPDGEFLKGVPLRCGEQMLRRGVDRLKQRGLAMEFIRLRKAMPTEAGKGRTQCHFCGHCMAGCEVDSKYTSANTPIPLATKTGKLQLFTETTMTRILMTNPRRIAGIATVDAQGKEGEIRAKALVLACSTIETARHLLINGLANSSGQVGRNLVSHFGLTVNGVFPGLRGRDHSDDDGTDYYHGLLTAMYWEKPSTRFNGTYQVQCGSGMQPATPKLRSMPGYGLALKRDLIEWNSTHAGLNMQGGMFASNDKFVELHKTRSDRNGLPLPLVHFHYNSNDLAMANDMRERSEEIIRSAGGRIVTSPGRATADNLVVDSNHWVGTVRMGAHPRTSVVNADCQSHDIPNLFVGDSSVFSTYPEKNPTLTNTALSWRMSERLAEKARRGELS